MTWIFPTRAKGSGPRNTGGRFLFWKLFCMAQPFPLWYDRDEVVHMRIIANLDRMGEGTYTLLRRGLLLSAALLAAGCPAILQNLWTFADICRDLSLSVLSVTAVVSCCMAEAG